MYEVVGGNERIMVDCCFCLFLLKIFLILLLFLDMYLFCVRFLLFFERKEILDGMKLVCFGYWLFWLLVIFFFLDKVIFIVSVVIDKRKKN